MICWLSMNGLQRKALLLTSSVLVFGCSGFGARRAAPVAAAPAAEAHTFVYVGATGGELDVLELDTHAGQLTRRAGRRTSAG